MSIDFDICFIMAAGMGTRMGTIGQILPKPLWPVNNKVLLDLQVSYAKDLGAKKIFINTHYKASEIEKYINHYYKDINVIFEKELLDIGGGLENLKNIVKRGRVLILNSDQLLFFDKDISLTAGSAANLVCVPADPNEKYNKTILDNGKVVGIEKFHDKMSDYYTYSGISLVDLQYITSGTTPKKFFNDTLDFTKHQILATKLSEFEYFDFGTKERYLKSLIKLNRNLASNQSTYSTMFYQKNLKFDGKLDFYHHKDWCESLEEVFGMKLKITNENDIYNLSLDDRSDSII